MSTFKSRGQLARDLEALQIDFKKLLAVVHVLRRLVTNAEYVRDPGNFAYVPTTGYGVLMKYHTTLGTKGNCRNRPASDFTCPPVETLYRHIMQATELEG